MSVQFPLQVINNREDLSAKDLNRAIRIYIVKDKKIYSLDRKIGKIPTLKPLGGGGPIETQYGIHNPVSDESFKDGYKVISDALGLKDNQKEVFNKLLDVSDENSKDESGYVKGELQLQTMQASLHSQVLGSIKVLGVKQNTIVAGCSIPNIYFIDIDDESIRTIAGLYNQSDNKKIESIERQVKPNTSPKDFLKSIADELTTAHEICELNSKGEISSPEETVKSACALYIKNYNKFFNKNISSEGDLKTLFQNLMRIDQEGLDWVKGQIKNTIRDHEIERYISKPDSIPENLKDTFNDIKVHVANRKLSYREVLQELDPNENNASRVEIEGIQDFIAHVNNEVVEKHPCIQAFEQALYLHTVEPLVQNFKNNTVQGPLIYQLYFDDSAMPRSITPYILGDSPASQITLASSYFVAGMACILSAALFTFPPVAFAAVVVAAVVCTVLCATTVSSGLAMLNNEFNNIINAHKGAPSAPESPVNSKQFASKAQTATGNQAGSSDELDNTNTSTSDGPNF
ncbi:hypothetical protein OAT84_02970 [Gammaproteobacteria bacterium]|nr:hypothetical protein [Gammaproteobacteria bacterium]